MKKLYDVVYITLALIFGIMNISLFVSLSQTEIKFIAILPFLIIGGFLIFQSVVLIKS